MLEIRVGSRVGPYKIVAPLKEAARGGMATLFLAQLARLEGTQLVILKIVPVEEEGGIAELNALRKEVEILQKLRHPNIVKIYPIPSRSGRREHYIARATNVPGNPWFCAMEHLGGGSLESRLRELALLPLGEAVEIACQIGSALDYMHSKGYVHWDVKPDNILFRYDMSENGIVEAVLIDFGIARGTHEPAVVAGTVRYMSAERLRVHMGEVPPEQIMDQRPADVYALGVVLYEMLAGDLPFVAEDEASIKSAILEEPPIPLTDFNYEVPAVVEDVIFQGLEKNPANRPPMEEMVTMLDRAVPAPRVSTQLLPVFGAAPGLAAERVEIPVPRRRREREEVVERPAKPPLIRRLWVPITALAVVLALTFSLWWPRVMPPPPTIDVISPPSPSVEEGIVQVSIEGENFRDGMAVFLTDSSGSRIHCLGVRVSDGGKMAQCSLDLSQADGGNGILEVSHDGGSASQFWPIGEPTPTPTSTSTPTPTNTPTPTLPPTDTPTPTVIPTLPPTGTPTATPTNTPPPVLPTNTPPPIPAAAVLLDPPNGAGFSGLDAAIELKWTEVKSLAADEYYVIRILFGPGWHADRKVKGTSYRLGDTEHFICIDHSAQPINWSVVVIRNPTDNDGDSYIEGTEVGLPSETRTFTWTGCRAPGPSREEPTSTPSR